MKTVFGDVLEDFLEIGNKLVPSSFNNNHQLLRCKIHKNIEREYLLSMPKNSSFLDIGANFGDTVLTMCLYAKNNGRSDIRFFAFEPNRLKCQFIEEVAERNNLKIKVYNCCVGNKKGYAINDGIIDTFSGASSFMYSDKDDTEKFDIDKIKVIKIDEIENIITPVGLIHIDVEGWEIEVLKGLHNILNNTKNYITIICECWPDKTAQNEKKKGRAFNILKENPRKEILNIIRNYNYEQLDDIIDMDENIVFIIRQK